MKCRRVSRIATPSAQLGLVVPCEVENTPAHGTARLVWASTASEYYAIDFLRQQFYTAVPHDTPTDVLDLMLHISSVKLSGTIST
ncbi:unnamed protein product [Periconia digitata]|uniref:Uncharacterized protein n=1 Tax=Periconia digitata TaxID=1303443 RepID=A0A9W4UIX3_9PLEO|nr:unnamed protein product [Periconia digitata]